MRFTPTEGEATKRMRRRGTTAVTWRYWDPDWETDRIYDFRYIPANQARNRNGSLAGGNYPADQVVLQMATTAFGETRYSNRW